MEQKPPGRRMKFLPKSPPKPKREPKVDVKSEAGEDDNNLIAKATELLRKAFERSFREPA